MIMSIYSTEIEERRKPEGHTGSRALEHCALNVQVESERWAHYHFM